MKKKGYTGKMSLPADFSHMSVNDLALALDIIKELFKKAKLEGGVISGNLKLISVPLKLITKVFGIDYSINIARTKEIERAISETQESIDALKKFEEIFFQKVKENFKSKNVKKVDLKVAAG